MAILITDEEDGRGMLIADEMLITDEEDGRGWPRSVRYIRYCGVVAIRKLLLFELYGSKLPEC